MLNEFHFGECGGHMSSYATAQKILREGLWWLIVHKDSKEYCISCDVCQRIGRPLQRDGLPLNPQVTLQAFDKWEIEFFNPIQPSGNKMGSCYIITMTKYLTRWAKTQPVKDCNMETTAKFIFKFILSRFG